MFRQHVMRPRIARIDREARRPVSGDRLPARILQNGAGAHEVRGEFITAKREDARVVIAMAGKFVPAIDDGAHCGGVAFGDPAQREEGRLDLGFIEQVEDARDIVAHAQFERVPVAARDGVLERADLEPVFHIDRQAVDDGSLVQRTLPGITLRRANPAIRNSRSSSRAHAAASVPARRGAPRWPIGARRCHQTLRLP